MHASPEPAAPTSRFDSTNTQATDSDSSIRKIAARFSSLPTLGSELSYSVQRISVSL
jgi:hypothetical protein